MAMTMTIHDAARSGDVGALMAFLSTDPLSLHARDRHSRTPLHLASWAGQAEVVRILCSKHAEVGASAVDDMAAIHFASQKGHVEVVRHLLTCGASVHSHTRKGMTPLHYACQGGHLDVAKLLIKKGAHLYSPNRAGKKAVDLAKDKNLRKVLITLEKESKEAKRRGKEENGSGLNSLPHTNSTEPDIARVEEEKEEKDGLAKDDIEDPSQSPPRKKTRDRSPSPVELHNVTDGMLGEQDSGSKDEFNHSLPQKKDKTQPAKVKLYHLGMDADQP